MIDIITYLESLNINNTITNLIYIVIFFSISGILNYFILLDRINTSAEAFPDETFILIFIMEFIFFIIIPFFTSNVMISSSNFPKDKIIISIISMFVGIGLSFCIAIIKFLKIYLRR